VFEHHFEEKALTWHVKSVKLVGQLAVCIMCLQGAVLNRRLHSIKRYRSWSLVVQQLPSLFVN